MTKKADQHSNTISADVAAALIRVTPRRLRQLTTEGWIKREGHGQYTIRGVVQGFLAFRDDQIERAERRNMDCRIRDARAREIELRTARAEGELVPTDLVVAYAQSVVDAVMTKLRELPPRVTTNTSNQERLARMIEHIGVKTREAGSEIREAWGRAW